MPVLLHAHTHDFAVARVQRGEKRRGSVALVIVSHRRAAPLFKR